MPAYSYVTGLQPITQTSSSVDLSTQLPMAWDVSDAYAASITFSVGASTAPGPTVFVAFTSESTAAFVKLTYNTSGGSVVITSSASAITVFPIAFKQMTVVTTGVHVGTHTHIANKLVIV
jgi:hypothetical protein